MNQAKLVTIATVALVFSISLPAKAETLNFYDDSFAVFNNGSLLSSSTPYFSAVWGKWDAGTSMFSTIVGINASNTGYVDLSTPELIVALNQTTNSNIASGAQLALAIYNSPLLETPPGSGTLLASSYNTSVNRAILVDSSWTAPTFANNANPLSYAFTAGTSAVFGTFSYNGGTEQIGMVPEPSTGALLMIGAAGLVALRRLRKV
jgi:hypothetical protein